MDDKRTDGQLWIDKNTNSLRYKSNGKHFSLSANESLTVENTSGTFKVGNLLAMAKEGLRKAKFPDDLENVVGVIGITPDSKGNTFVTKQGTVVIDKDVFYYTDNNQLQVGLPVYWFISDTFTPSSEPKYSKEDDYSGRLTTLTPSGFKGFSTEYTGDTGYNVGYDNLPQVGIITEVNNIDNTVTVYVNIDKFDSSLEWNYPYLHGKDGYLDNAGCTKYEPINGEVTINIYHGLCQNDDIKDNFIPKCRCNIVAIEKDASNITTKAEYPVLGCSDLVTDNNNITFTQITLKTADTMRYRISGTINYKYDRDHEKVRGE